MHQLLLCPLDITPRHMETNCRKRRTFAHCVDWKLSWLFGSSHKNLNSQEKWDDKLRVVTSETWTRRDRTPAAPDWSHTLGLFLTATGGPIAVWLLSSFLSVKDAQGHGFIWLRLSAARGSLTLQALTVWQMALSGSLSLSVVAYTKRVHAHRQRGRGTNTHTAWHSKRH